MKKFENKRNTIVIKETPKIEEVTSEEESHDIDDIDQSVSEHSISSRASSCKEEHEFVSDIE